MRRDHSSSEILYLMGVALNMATRQVIPSLQQVSMSLSGTYFADSIMLEGKSNISHSYH